MSKQKIIEQLKDDPLMPLRHTTEHVLQMSIESLYKGSSKVMGPPIKDGFYGDFDLQNKISSEDLSIIEDRMKEIINLNLPVKMKEVTYDKAQDLFKDNKYKLELLEEIKSEDKKITICEIGDEKSKYHDIDLCGGSHVKNTGDIKAFKLLNIAGAYWRGDEKNKMLTRIYGTAFDNMEDLQKHLDNLEEAKLRDHRKIGKDLELFMYDDEVGQGLTLWLPNGAFIKHKISEFAFNTYLENGYKPVSTPHIASEALWSHSGHLDFYTESMYNSFGIDEEQYRLKPMNCPMHTKIYKLRPRSYKELPLRLTEMGTVYRYEKSGTLHGLTRVRGFTQDDAHIICTPDQLHEELVKALNLTFYILKTFGFEQFEVNLSIRDPENKDKFIGSDEGWKTAEKELVSALSEVGFKDYITDVGGAVFYGPKIDIKVEDSIGRKWQLSTIQFDFNLPSRFDMTYIGEDGKEHVPYMIHRALLGSLERFIGVYIEHTAGAFPMWLCPIQVMIIPITERHVKYAKIVQNQLSEKGFRVEVDDREDKMQSKIRDSQMKKIPYMLIVGDKEEQKNEVSVRLRNGQDQGSIKIYDLIEKLNQMYLTKSPNLW